MREIAGMEKFEQRKVVMLFRAGIFALKTERKKAMDVRTEYDSGKLLFQWNPQSNVISIVRKDVVYDVRLLFADNGGYEIIRRTNKKKCRAPPHDCDCSS